MIFIAVMFTVMLLWEMSFQVMIGTVNFVSKPFNPVLYRGQTQELFQEHNQSWILKGKTLKSQELWLPKILLRDLSKTNFHLIVIKKITSFLQGKQKLPIKIIFKCNELQDQKLMKLWIFQIDHQGTIKIKDLSIIQLSIYAI